MDPMDIVGKSKEDASLPKATMTKIIKEMLPADIFSSSVVLSLMKSVTKRINEQSHPSMYGEEVYAAYEQHRYETIQDSQRSVKMNTSAEMTEEEAAAEQQRMFTEDRARMNGGPCSTEYICEEWSVKRVD
uniref:Uncharacterized protein n=1 Tax=Brassica oleracea TaxID=3712 RepID=A0A3P5ZZM1_BRAOL|nr:unnamed protein product [Brassica oleracea]